MMIDHALGIAGRPRRERHPHDVVRAHLHGGEVPRAPLAVRLLPLLFEPGEQPRVAGRNFLRQGNHAANASWRCPELILLDLNLPRLTGREVLERIRATPSFRTVPIVVLTTSRRQEDIQDVYAAGANTYIEKPRDFGRFVEVLQTIQRYWLDAALLPPAL